ncbi:hypothetical protein G6048_46135 [Streptomyces sp. YC419]|uniref:Uncharacterized protein n=2 Tax=Streptomyces ureilyticus TaxID=1775131 RepID=A0ABX0E4K4_9ACTN|nr:hypothetical protein [Streptomyces ureilyticus]
MRMVKVNLAIAAILVLFVTVVGLRAVIDSGKTWTYDKVFEETGELYDVMATADDDVWVAGDSFLLHDDGTGWQRRPLPASFGGGLFEHVRFDAVGSSGILLTASMDETEEGESPRMARWDGSRWTALPGLPDGHPVADVRAFAADDIWVLDGDAGASHWDGVRWTAMDLPVAVTALDGVASGDLWAVGYHYPDGPDEGLGLPGAQPATLHWDGRAWRSVPTPEYHYSVPAPEQLAYFTDVVALAKDDIRVYGDHTSIPEDDEPDPAPEALRLRWNGTGWTKLPNSKGACSDRGPWVRDGEHGVVLSASRYLTAGGNCEGISLSELPSADWIGSGARQSLRLNAIAAVPGTDKVLGVGSVEVTHDGSSANRSAIVSLKR